MATIRPFAGIRFNEQDQSDLIAPPYDVLDEAGKRALQAKSPYNIVSVDWPYPKQKIAGPDELYEQAAKTLSDWIGEGVLKRDEKPALYAYEQTYTHEGRTYQRRGFIGLVKLSPFGAGEVVPHEKTYQGAIEDRMKLMKATKMQLSPIFGLFSDPKNEVTSLLFAKNKQETKATLDGVENKLFAVTDEGVIAKVAELMKDRSVYIADGHHRYTTALAYQKEAGTIPADHPANYCMFVLVSMQDPGLIILPTHRIIGGLENFSIEKFSDAVKANFDVSAVDASPAKLDEFVAKMKRNTFGLYDGSTKKTYLLTLKNKDVLKDLEPEKSKEWRSLDVAILQRYLLDEILQPKFAGGKELTKAYTAYARQVPEMTDGKNFQIALLLQSTPLSALEDLKKYNEVMPQKSTYFFPKLATGMVINPFE